MKRTGTIPIKYWLLTTEFPPFYGGGIASYCMHTAEMLAPHTELTVFLPDKNIKQRTIRQENQFRLVKYNPYHYEEKKFLGYESLCSYALAMTIIDLIEEEGKPDCIESQEYNGLAYFPLLFKRTLHPRLINVPFVVTIHAPSFICFEYNHVAAYRQPYYWIQQMERFCLFAADHLVAPSAYVMQEIKRFIPGFNQPYTIIRNPFFRKKENESIAAGEKNHLIFYGKASPIKGVFETLNAFERIWKGNPNVKLEILGGLDYFYHPESTMMGTILERRYRDRIKNGQLKLSGKINPSQLRERLKFARAVLLPSTFDNLPYAMIESLAIGKMVIASKTSGQSEIIQNGKTGYLLNPKNRDEFEKVIDEVLQLNDKQIIEIGANGKETVDTLFNPEIIAKEKLALITSINDNKITGKFPFTSLSPTQQSYEWEKRNTRNAEDNLTVVIPYFNMGGYLQECISSIISSTLKPIRILIVNDGSTDPISIRVLDKFRGLENIDIIDKQNAGLAAARNTGATLVNTTYMAFLDPDDTVEPSYYEQAIRMLKHYDNLHFIGSWVNYFGATNGTWPCFTPEPPMVLYHNMANTSSLVYKTASFKEAGWNDSHFVFGMEDYDSMLSMISNGLNGTIIPVPLFNYRVRPDSMMRKFTQTKVLYLYQLLAQKHTTLFNQYGATLSLILNSNGPGLNNDNPAKANEAGGGRLLINLKRIPMIRKAIESPIIRTTLLKIYSKINSN